MVLISNLFLLEFFFNFLLQFQRYHRCFDSPSGFLMGIDLKTSYCWLLSQGFIPVLTSGLPLLCLMLLVFFQDWGWLEDNFFLQKGLIGLRRRRLQFFFGWGNQLREFFLEKVDSATPEALVNFLVGVELRKLFLAQKFDRVTPEALAKFFDTVTGFQLEDNIYWKVIESSLSILVRCWVLAEFFVEFS